MTNREEITKRLLLFVKEKNWSKSDFARVSGIHRQNADRYLTGQSDPSRIGIKLMTEGLNIDWLLTGEGEMMVNKTDVQQPVYKHSPMINQEVNDQGIKYRGQGDVQGVIAIGSKMTPDKIAENDFLIIDKSRSPDPGDYVLRKAKDAPEIARFESGDPAPIGVVIKLIRQYK